MGMHKLTSRPHYCLHVVQFQVTKFQDDVESKNKVVGAIVSSFATKTKRKRKLLQTLDQGGIALAPNTQNISSSIDPPKLVVGQWQWQPPFGWIQQQFLQTPPWLLAQWGMELGQFLASTSAPLIQQAFVPLVKQESAVRATQKVMKKENNSTSGAQQTIGKKPHQIKIKVGGDINGCYDGKNAWDETMRTLIPRILDVNVLSWEGHALDSLEKLWVALNKELNMKIMSFQLWDSRTW